MPEPRGEGWVLRGVNPRIWLSSRTRLLLLAATAAMMLGMAAPVRASLRSDVLEAIHMVENPHDVRRPGRHGELGAYQFRQETWRMHSQAPFAQALDRSASDAVAIQHFEWISRSFTRAGVSVTAYNVALAWNGGLQAAIKGRVPAATRDYAERVNNLVEDMHAHQLADSR